MNLPAGTIVAEQYEILGVLGEGSTGRVYDARRLLEGDEVALKVLHPNFASDAQVRARFEREATILAQLKSEYISPLLAWGEASLATSPEGSLLYFVQPKIDGLALDQLLDREAPLAEDRIFKIAKDLCRGLSSAHALGILHRDLKPANVMMGEHAVIIDFGLAKVLEAAGSGVDLVTNGNALVGTPEYMSPEQARGDALDITCDLYALGIILYEMLTGSVPFASRSALTVLTAQMNERPPDPRKKRATISLALESVLIHSLAKDPRARYRSADDVALAIDLARTSPSDARRVHPGQVAARAKDDPPTVPEVAAPPSSSSALEFAATQPSVHPPAANPISSTAAAAPQARRTQDRPRVPEGAARTARLSSRSRRTLAWVAAITVGSLLGATLAWLRHRAG